MTPAELSGLLRESGSDPVVLSAGQTRVIVAPRLCGRVMAFYQDGDDQLTEYINAAQICAGFSQTGSRGWNNFGGAERVWLAPEGGPHGLMFECGPQTYDRYRVQASHHAVPYVLRSAATDHAILEADLAPVMASGRQLAIHVQRRITALSGCPLATGETMLRAVGFESVTTLTNAGDAAWSWEDGVPAVWTLCQFLCTPATLLAVPLIEGAEAELGPPVITEYLQHLCENGRMPDDGWDVSPRCLLLRADGTLQSKLDVGPRRTTGLLSGIDLEKGVMHLVSFEPQPTADYVASYWEPWAGDPRRGAALSVFCLRGECGTGDDAPFFELETFSPAMALRPGESFSHRVRTWRLVGPPGEIMDIACGVLQADPLSIHRLSSVASRRRCQIV